MPVMPTRLLFVLLCLRLSAAAQDAFYTHYQTFGEEAGYKVFERPGAITQDRRGLVWIGSDNGLYAFDGTHFRNYRHQNSDSLSLPGNQVSFLFQDSKGVYWTSVSGQGLYLFDPATGAFRRFHYKNENGFSIHQYIINLPCEAASGIIWFPLPGFGIAAYNRATNEVVPYKICPAGNCGLYMSASWVTAITEDPADSTLWLASNKGLLHFFPRSGRVAVFQKSGAANIYTFLFFDQQQRFWLGTWSDGLVLFNRATTTFTQYKWASSGRAGTRNICTGIGQHSNSQLWVGSIDRSLMLFDIETGTFRTVRGNRAGNDPLMAVSLLQNGQGVLWVANQQTLVRLPAADDFFLQHSLVPAMQQAPEAHGAYSFLRVGDTVYAGIFYGGNLIAYHLKTHGQKRYVLPNKKHLGITTLSKDASNRIWVCGTSGTYLFHPRTGTFSKPHAPAAVPDLFHWPASVILHCADETVWLGTRRGLVWWDAAHDSVRVYGYDSSGQNGLRLNTATNRINALYKDRNGNLWFGNNEHGLACYRHATGTIHYFNSTRHKSYPNGNCISITESADGAILFTLDHKGLYVLKQPFEPTETITDAGSGANFPSDNISQVFKDRDGRYWLFTADGLYAFDFSTSRAMRYGTEDGLVENNLYGFPYQDNEGWMYLGFGDCFQQFDPRRLLANKTNAGMLHLASLKINGKEWPVHPDYLSALSLNYTQANMAFDFGMLSRAQQTTGLQYAYKLDGLEHDWTYTGAKTFGQYNSLAPGHYTLRIKAAGRDGTWLPTQLALPIVIHPPWYNTWWFYSIIGLLCAALLYALHRYRIRTLLRLQQMRTQIASDLHDDIGATLTGISFYSELVKMQLPEQDGVLKNMLDKIGGNARSAVTAMSDAVWVINPANDGLETMAARIKSQALERCGERGIECGFDLHEHTPKKLSMLQRKNVYLIFKEALHNAIKYSGCSRMFIVLHQTEASLCLEVKDDGRGFDKTQVQGLGNGLENMKRRAAEMKASLTIATVPGSGTQVRLHVKIT